jgi:hypothetical protein
MEAFVLPLAPKRRGNPRTIQSKTKKPRDGGFCGPTWARTKDHLIMSQVL